MSKQYQVEDMISGKLVDKDGKKCPRALKKILQQFGALTISTREINWERMKKDMKAITGRQKKTK